MTNNKQVICLHSNPNILWKNKKPLLRTLDIELTERCNNNCLHCCINLPEKDAHAKKNELTTNEWKNVLDQAAALGALTVRFTGGEPLIREDFNDLYLYARHIGLRVLLFTNARLITPQLARLFSKVPPIEKIEVTVYGMRPESYTAVSRKQKAYAECFKGIDLLLDYKIPFIVKGTVFPQTIDEMEDFIAWASKIPWMNSLPTFPMYLDLRHRRDSEAKNRQIRKLRLSPQEGLRILTRDPDLYRHEMAKFCSQFLETPNDKIFNCNAHNAICVDAYGKIQFCLALRHPDTVLDFKQNSLEEMLTEFIPQLRQKQSNNKEFLERCGRCFLRGFCEQCPAKSWNEHGTLDQPVDYICQVAHEQAVYLGLLKKEEKAWQIKNWKPRLRKLTQIIHNNNINLPGERSEKISFKGDILQIQ